MDDLVCCICQKPVGTDASSLGGRVYCAEHYAKLSHNRGSVWRTSLISLVAVVIFAAAVALIAGGTKPVLSGAGLTWIGILLALVPALLWLVFFYAQDRLEPEPKHYVIGVALIAGLLASAVGIPVIRSLFGVQNWLDYNLLVYLLGSVLVVGFVQEFLKYAAVRYSVYLLPEFDEPMDGVLYGTAAGLGYATMLNIHYVIDSGGVDLGIGIIRIVVTALAQASFAGISGYFLGRAKFEDEPVWWLPLGVSIAAVLNGVFSVVLGGLARTQAVVTGSMLPPWLSLVLAAVVAAVTLGVLLALIRRASRLTVAGA